MNIVKRVACFVLATISLALISVGSWAAVVTLDVATKSATSDTATITAKPVQTRGDQVSVHVWSTINNPQVFILKVTGLKENAYDLHLNDRGAAALARDRELDQSLPAGAPRAVLDPATVLPGKTRAELEQGVTIVIPGTPCDADAMRCLKSLQPKVELAYERLRTSKEGEPARADYMLQQATDWLRGAIRQDEVYRSAFVALVPSGHEPELTLGRTRVDAAGTAAAAKRACWLLQWGRNRMFTAIEDLNLRNSTVVALTPVALGATYNAMKKKPHVEVKLVNDCDLPISGKISFALPKGWISSAKNLSFGSLKSGKTFTVSFDLAPLAKGATVPSSIPIAADVKVVQDQSFAKFSLKTEAKTLADAPRVSEPKAPQGKVH